MLDIGQTTLDPPFIGMRRVSLVRIVVDVGGITCVAVGVNDRLPCERQIALSTAIALRRSGVPAVFVSAGRRPIPPAPTFSR